jgi:hypothetical protein
MTETRKPRIFIDVSEPTRTLLIELAKIGVYGVTAEEVAARFVERQLETFIRTPIWSVTGESLAMIVKKESNDDGDIRKHPG